jgi:hypothetical protein
MLLANQGRFVNAKLAAKKVMFHFDRRPAFGLWQRGRRLKLQAIMRRPSIPSVALRRCALLQGGWPVHDSRCSLHSECQGVFKTAKGFCWFHSAI